MSDKAALALWDTAAGKRVAELAGHKGHVNAAAFSSDGQTLLTGGADKTARLWSADSGVALTTLQGHKGVVLAVAASPDGSMVATLDKERCVRWWNPRSSSQIGPPCISPNSRSTYEFGRAGFRFIHRDVVAEDGTGVVDFGPVTCFIRGLGSGILFPDSQANNCRADDACVVDPKGRVYDRQSGKRQPLPVGRKFSEALTRFATNGRFLALDKLVDLYTEQSIGGLGDDAYVPDRHTFVGSYRLSPRYISIPASPLDAEVAQLFAEAVTCHELDPTGTTRRISEATRDKRRSQLVQLLRDRVEPALIRRVASDPWFWVRRQVDRAGVRSAFEEEIKYLDRLIAVEPTWQNYQRRSLAHQSSGHHIKAAWDVLEAGNRAGGGYWCTMWRNDSIGHTLNSFDLDSFAHALIDPAEGRLQDYELGWQLAKALSGSKPEDRDRRLLLAIALYRVGRYLDALSLLEGWQHERERVIVAQAGQFFMSGWPVSILDRRPVRWDAVQAMAFLAMTHHCLGHRDRARAGLADLRKMGDEHVPFLGGPGSLGGRNDAGPWKGYQQYEKLLHEAEAIIEGGSKPGK